VSLVVEAVGFPAPGAKAEVEALAGAFEPAWYTTLNADRARPAWFLARRAGRLVGFLTVFDISGTEAEVEAFVDPAHRRQGVFSALLTEARRVWDDPDRRWLLVVDRDDPDGTAAARRQGRLSFTEWRLALDVEARPPFPGLPAGLVLTEGGADDLQDAADVFLLTDGQDGHRTFLERILADPERRFFVLREAAQVVGVGCLHQEGTQTMVHGLVVRPDRQGRGWGRALVTVLLDLGAPGTERFSIEVDSSNHRAEALYRSVGFTDQDVTDYYEL
jgi:GNAT superfamily N-acetyltransferase